ncbi:esterase family protein [Arsenicicoccus piscis]|nr:alpha/beta hydrolase family protein [Arsenicicoccus piscis]MCH8627658.1 esterase family protein [Arsenicicoccus piscis]
MSSAPTRSLPVSRRALLGGGAAALVAAGGGALGLQWWREDRRRFAIPAPSPVPIGTLDTTPLPGLSVGGRSAVGERATRHVLHTALVQRQTDVIVRLPASYASAPARRYPVLYLLHGTGADCTSWWTDGQAAQLVGDREVILVIPDCGGAGWFTDWPHPSAGRQDWESFHIRQLVPWVDQTFRTLAEPGGRALAGNSMGGYGAVVYAARYRQLFDVAAAFSGVGDLGTDYAATEVYDGPADFGGDRLGAIYGTDPEAVSRAIAPHDPVLLADRMRGLRRLALYCGDGTPDALGGAAGGEEAQIRVTNDHLVRALRAQGVAFQWHPQRGVHAWPYWRRHLAAEIGPLTAALAPARG